MSIANRELIEQMSELNGGVAGSRKLNDELYPLAIAGDQAARTRLIESNMALVVSKVESYLNYYPHLNFLVDDLLSEGFVTLTESIDAIMAKGFVSNANVTGYLSKSILRKLGNIVDSESSTVRVADRTARRRRTEGGDVPKPLVNVGEVPESLPTTENPLSLIELRDQVHACCQDEDELFVIQSREAGYTYAEIAKALDQPQSTTYMMTREVYGRFLVASGLEGEV